MKERKLLEKYIEKIMNFNLNCTELFVKQARKPYSTSYEYRVKITPLEGKSDYVDVIYRTDDNIAVVRRAEVEDYSTVIITQNISTDDKNWIKKMYEQVKFQCDKILGGE